MMNQIPDLKIGDKIGFVLLASDVDSNDKIIFCPVVEITTRDGERAYRYQFPDGTISSAAIKQSDLSDRVLQIEPAGVPDMLSISDRRAEFVEALERGKNSRFEVFPYWDRDTFVVVNQDNKNEYHVELQTANGRLYGQCSCPDYTYRKRLCKHISEVLTTTIFSAAV